MNISASFPSERTFAKERTRQTLEYVRSMLRELSQMAESERCDMVAYLIGMAYVEACDALRGEVPIRAHCPIQVPAQP